MKRPSSIEPLTFARVEDRHLGRPWGNCHSSWFRRGGKEPVVNQHADEYLAICHPDETDCSLAADETSRKPLPRFAAVARPLHPDFGTLCLRLCVPP